MLFKSLSEIENRVIYYAIIVSCLVHLTFLAISYFIIPKSVKTRVKNVEIVYHGKKAIRTQPAEAHIKSVSEMREAKKNLEAVTERMLKEKQIISKDLLRDATSPMPRTETGTKQLAKVSEFVEKRSISVPVLTSQKITNPQYLSYNDRIRDKIRNRAYFYIDDPSFKAGEVYLTFVVTADGNLKDLQILEARSRANDYLRAVGLRSIKESSPFPPFPAELKYPELSFNVVISFEVNNKP